MARVHKPSVQVKYDVATHGTQQPKVIVLHDTEGPDSAGYTDIEGVANFWKRQGLGYGSHIIVDKDGNTGQGAAGNRICWHVANHNTGAIGIEQIGFAWWNVTKWKAREAQLHKVAKWIAWWSLYYKIPIVHDITNGVCMHRDFTDGTHTDPGSGYPFAYVLDLARSYKKNGW